MNKRLTLILLIGSLLWIIKIESINSELFMPKITRLNGLKIHYRKRLKFSNIIQMNLSEKHKQQFNKRLTGDQIDNG